MVAVVSVLVLGKPWQVSWGDPGDDFECHDLTVPFPLHEQVSVEELGRACIRH